jgi:hypothetical protein
MENQDEILMNVIDYFTEKWNEKKSNGTKGEMKPFEFNIIKPDKIKKMVQIFDWSLSNDQIIFKSYRNTADQSLKETCDGKVIYNKRKLNEFLFVIDKLKDGQKRFQILKEFVYNETIDTDNSFFHVQNQYLYNERSLNSLNNNENSLNSLYGFLKGNQIFPLFPAAFYNHKEIILSILNNKNFDINERNSLSSSALHFGIKKDF